MKQEDNTYIEELIERFFEGSTTNEEEKKIYSFFEQENIPEHLSEYKSIFTYFETDIQAEFKEDKRERLLTRKIGFRYKWLIAVTSVAATILILFILLPPMIQPNHRMVNLQGSYIITNGEKITDLEVIVPELEKVISSAEQKYLESEKKFESLNRKIQQYEIIHIETDPAIIINKNFSGKVREEAYRILELSY